MLSLELKNHYRYALLAKTAYMEIPICMLNFVFITITIVRPVIYKVFPF